eukprot:2930726-Karenia_brevis.AAC.1
MAACKLITSRRHASNLWAASKLWAAAKDQMHGSFLIRDSGTLPSGIQGAVTTSIGSRSQ